MNAIAIILPIVFGSILFILLLVISVKMYEKTQRVERETTSGSSNSSEVDIFSKLAYLRSCLGFVESQRQVDPENKFTEEELIAEVKGMTESQQHPVEDADEVRISSSTSELGRTHLISNTTDATLPPYKP